ncbi:unnamed protein product [Meloidogyne enterolobii]|uniref:Uncharacterized protein n=1 Tax=Meloidogyne enterolobii TaxID=390850 RepID=A0ACB0XKT4_MELEN
MPLDLVKPDNEQLIPELLAALKPKSCKLVPAPDLNSASFNLETARFGQQIYIMSDSFNFEEAKKQLTGNVQLLTTKDGYHIFTDGRPAIEVIYLCLIDIIEWKLPVKLLLNKLLGNENWEMVYAEKCSSSFSECKSPATTDFGLLRVQKLEENINDDEKELKNKEKKQVEVWLTPVNQCIPKKVKKKVLRKVPKKSVKNGLIIQNDLKNNYESNSSESREQTPSQTTTSEEISISNNGNKNEINGDSKFSIQNGKTENLTNGTVGRIANKFNGMASGEQQKNNISNNLNNYSSSSSINQRSRSHSLEEKEQNENVKSNSSAENRRYSNPTNILNEDYSEQKLADNHQQQPIYLEIPVQLSLSPTQTKENENNNHNNLSENILTNNEDDPSHRRASLTESPPPRSTADSDSPNSLSYVSAHADIIHSSNRRPWRREDAPSPSTSLILQNARRNVASITPTNQIINGPIHRLVTPLGSNLSPISSCGSVEGQQDFDKAINNKNTISCTDSRSYYDDEEDEDESTLMLLNKERRGASADDGDELTIMSSIREDLSLRDNYHSNITRNHQHLNGNNRIIRGRHGKHNNFNNIGHSPSPPLRNSALSRSVGSRGALSRSPSAAASHNLQMVRGMLGTFRMPVPALQQILGLFSFKEIGILRRVHPHWDELAGQLLNVAHFRLIQRAQHLLTDCQRRVTREPRMAQPVKLLTRLHVHALNPVDGMRAFMDEGVLCFPYGAFLDQAFSLLSRIDLMIENNYFDEEKQEKEYNEADNLMDKLAEITKKAVLHYKQWVEPEAEKRMSELYRVSAQQRLQRIDSFLVESSVSRVEREAEKNRNEMSWEMEQLKQQNTQLKKESRDLRQLCQRLDQRVDVLERKFKTMARLLQ